MFGADYAKGKIVPIRGMPRRIRRCLATPSRRRGRAWTRTSARRTPIADAPHREDRGVTPPRYLRSSTSPRRDAISASSASPGSTCCKLNLALDRSYPYKQK